MKGISKSRLIVLAPVEPRCVELLPALLSALPKYDDSPFARVPGTHFARFVFIEGLPGANLKPMPSEGSYLLMCADFDSNVRKWSEHVCKVDELMAVMKCWERFPRVDKPAKVARFLKRYHVTPGVTAAGYSATPVQGVHDALRMRRELRELAVRSQHGVLAADELRRQWRRVVSP